MPFYHHFEPPRFDVDMGDPNGYGGIPLDDMTTESASAIDSGGYGHENETNSIPFPGVSSASMDLPSHLFDFNVDPLSLPLDSSTDNLASQGVDTSQYTAPESITNSVAMFQDGVATGALAPMLEGLFDDIAPGQLSNPNPHILGSGNLDLAGFLRRWSSSHGRGAASSGQSRPQRQAALDQCSSKRSEVLYSDLKGDECDLQGLDWTAMGANRGEARARRKRKHQNHTNREGSDEFNDEEGDRRLPSKESYFRFKRAHMRQDIKLAHFQLRNVVACPERTHAYYPGAHGINRIDLVSKRTEVSMKMNEFVGFSSPITSLDANHGVLFSGTFSGEYYMKPLGSLDNTTFSDGVITPNTNGITNHLKIHTPRRSSKPVVAISSNDSRFRVMDIETQKFVSEFQYDCALNCSAVSPDRRLRVLVGDCLEALITCAETGKVLQELEGPRDFGFACAWSDDGWTIATAAQDKCIKIWDARRLCNVDGKSSAVCTLRTDIGAARSLHFSPVGTGPPVLVAVEEVDNINIINARTFATKQTIDVFGELGGAAFTNDGQDLNVLCGDRTRGCLLQLERCGQPADEYDANLYSSQSYSASRGLWSQASDGPRWVPQSERRSGSTRPGFGSRMRPSMSDNIALF